MEPSQFTRAWMDLTFRVFRRMDILMPQWADMTLKRLGAEHRLSGTPAPTLCMVYHRLLRMVLCDETDLRIVNGTVYFLRNDVMCMQLRQFSHAEADALLAGWFQVFAQRVKVGAGHDYFRCLHPQIVDAQFPRFELAARFMCTQLRADVEAGDGGASAACPYRFGVYYAMQAAVSLLLVDPATRDAASRLHAILTERHARVFVDWDDAREVYPGYRADRDAKKPTTQHTKNAPLCLTT